VLAIWANNRQETLLVMPPLVIDAAEVDEVLDGLGRAAAVAAAA
jgi:adenosylmethionine-8-amino-7-oxononanoate aminotransferase